LIKIHRRHGELAHVDASRSQQEDRMRLLLALTTPESPSLGDEALRVHLSRA
jgi:hypothetical protein